MMNRGANSDSIPMDLIPEILSRLPAKSIARFRCVSKPWKSIICRQVFTELFRTMSSSNPRLLIGVVQEGGWSFFSSPQPQDHYGQSLSLVVAADFHTKFSEESPCYFSYASGLFYIPYWRVSMEYDDHSMGLICNPSTGQYAILPPDDLIPRYGRIGNGLLGFDPIGKQYKVLVSYSRAYCERKYQILTLGTEKWREIKCPNTYDADSNGICINGVLYYKSCNGIGCFDVRSEKFKFLDVDRVVLECFQDLINYKGKLCGIHLKYGQECAFPLKLSMWVLEDFEKGEWSMYAYTLSPENNVVKVNYHISVVGGTASGEIVLAEQKANTQFCVFYFNPETNTLLSVEIQGGEEWSPYSRVHCFVDHVEDLNFDVMKTTYDATSIHPSEQSTSASSREDHHQVRTVSHLEQDRHSLVSVNKFDALSLSDDD